jgi:hypothetical protein
MIPEWLGWWDGMMFHTTTLGDIIGLLALFAIGNIWNYRQKRRMHDDNTRGE